MSYAVLIKYPQNKGQVLITTDYDDIEWLRGIISAIYKSNIEPLLWEVAQGITIKHAVENLEYSTSSGTVDLSTQEGQKSFFEKLDNWQLDPEYLRNWEIKLKQQSKKID